MKPAVFLDRDGVLVQGRIDQGVLAAPQDVSDLRLAPDAPEAVRRLRAAGFVLVMATNQPDVARGKTDRTTVEQINTHVEAALGLDDVRCCFHDDADDCPCRKPRPGLLVEAAADLDLDLSRSWMIGDRWVDIAAAHTAGVRSVLVECEYSWQPSAAGSPPAGLEPTACVPSLGDAVTLILEREI